MNPGKYAYRFTGHAMSQGIPHYLAGVGTMVLGPGKKISGFHAAAFTALEGFDAEVTSGRFLLDGRYGLRTGAKHEDDVEAVITFTQLETDVSGKPLQVLKGTFNLVPAGGADGFWMISTGAKHVDSGKAAVELVSGEAVRITTEPEPSMKKNTKRSGS